MSTLVISNHTDVIFSCADKTNYNVLPSMSHSLLQLSLSFAAFSFPRNEFGPDQARFMNETF